MTQPYEMAFVHYGGKSTDLDLEYHVCENGNIQAMQSVVWMAEELDRSYLGSPDNLEFVDNLEESSTHIFKQLLYTSIQEGWEEVGVIEGDQRRHVLMHPEDPSTIKSLSFVSSGLDEVLGIEVALWQEAAVACQD